MGASSDKWTGCYCRPDLWIIFFAGLTYIYMVVILVTEVPQINALHEEAVYNDKEIIREPRTCNERLAHVVIQSAVAFVTASLLLYGTLKKSIRILWTVLVLEALVVIFGVFALGTHLVADAGTKTGKSAFKVANLLNYGFLLGVFIIWALHRRIRELKIQNENDADRTKCVTI